MPDGKEKAKRVLAALRGKVSEGASAVGRRVEAWEAERKEEREWLESIKKDEARKQKALTARAQVRQKFVRERRSQGIVEKAPRRRSRARTTVYVREERRSTPRREPERRESGPFGSLSFFGEEPRRRRRD
jgi:biopolymer transport protein ExbB/TolQ